MPLQDEKQTAEQLGIKSNTLSKMACLGRLPPWYYVGRAVRYDPADVKTWLDSRKVHSTSEPPDMAALAMKIPPQPAQLGGIHQDALGRWSDDILIPASFDDQYSVPSIIRTHLRTADLHSIAGGEHG